MERIYKLAANFNTVEFKPTREDLLEMVDYDSADVFYDENFNPQVVVEDNVLLERLLQREYDILASISPVQPIAGKPQQVAASQRTVGDKPTDGQIRWAKSKGIPDPESMTKQELWKLRQKYE
jgi:hypothetical protein